MSRLLISGAGAVCHGGLGLDGVRAAVEGDARFSVEELRPGERVRVGRVGRIRDPESAAAYRRWAQLDTYSRYGFVAARQALESSGWIHTGREPVGVLFGTAFGCMEENQRFDRFGIEDGVLRNASPLAFKGTVDNAPAGWVAVAFGLKGPNATFVSGDGAALEALWAAESSLRARRAPALLVGGIERFVDLHLLLRERDPRREAAVPAEGAGVICVEREASVKQRGLDPDRLVELVGVTRRRGSLGGALGAGLQQLGLREDEVGLLSLAVPPDRPLPALHAGLEAIALREKAGLGEPHGAWGGLALCAALVRRDLWAGRVALVHAFGEGDEHFFAALRAPAPIELERS